MSEVQSNYRLVPDDTVNKGTSKHQKMDEKSTNLVVHVSPSFFLNIPTTPFIVLRTQWYDKISNAYREKCTIILLILFWFGFDPKKLFTSC